MFSAGRLLLLLCISMGSYGQDCNLLIGLSQTEEQILSQIDPEHRFINSEGLPEHIDTVRGIPMYSVYFTQTQGNPCFFQNTYLYTNSDSKVADILTCVGLRQGPSGDWFALYNDKVIIARLAKHRSTLDGYFDLESILVRISYLDNVPEDSRELTQADSVISSGIATRVMFNKKTR